MTHAGEMVEASAVSRMKPLMVFRLTSKRESTHSVGFQGDSLTLVLSPSSAASAASLLTAISLPPQRIGMMTYCTPRSSSEEMTASENASVNARLTSSPASAESDCAR